MSNIGAYPYATIMERLQLSPAVLGWAAREAGLSLTTVAERLSRRNPDRIVEGQLTEPQVEKFANLTGVPLGYLFMAEPPAPRPPPIADFRTTQRTEPLSRNFFDCFDEVQFKQDWYREHLDQIGAAPLDFVGKFAGAEVNRDAVARDIRENLRLANLDRSQLRSPDDLYSLLVDRCESLGILVFKNGVVGSNNTRPLSPEEFRGFALCDPVAPVVFINGADSAAAWPFTLTHELAHIWLGDSGISDTNPKTNIRAEADCNAIAAEVLVPRDEFKRFWEQYVDYVNWSARRTIAEGRLYFRVSEIVIARRALDLGLIDFTVYRDVHVESSRRGRDNSGGNFYRTLSVRNSKKFTERVAAMAVSGSLSFREAGKLLGVTPSRIANVYKNIRALST